jgi:hypothetical protein
LLTFGQFWIIVPPLSNRSYQGPYCSVGKTV